MKKKSNFFIIKGLLLTLFFFAFWQILPQEKPLVPIGPSDFLSQSFPKLCGLPKCAKLLWPIRSLVNSDVG
jgi:hypothetical protein